MKNLEKLMEDLKNPDSNVRLEAVSVIKETEKNGVNISSAIPTLLKVLCDEDKKVRWAAVDVVSAYNTKGDTFRYKESLHVIQELTSDDIKKKVQYTDMLRINTEYDMIRDRDERNIEHAIPALAASIFDESLDVKNGALDAIYAAIYNDQNIIDAFPALIKTLSSEDENPRKLASLILRDATVKGYDISEYIPIFNKSLSDNFEPVKFGAADALTYYYAKKNKWDEVKSLLNHADKDVRQEAAGTLAHGYDLKIEPVIPDLKKLLNDENEDVQIVAARTLAKRSKKIDDFFPIIPIIKKTIFHQNNENRIYAAVIIYQITDFISNLQDEEKNIKKLSDELWYPITQIIEELEKALLDKDQKVIRDISKSLTKYYLRINRPEDIIRILKNLDKKMEEEVLKYLEYDKWKKPSVLISYITQKDNTELIKKFDEAVRNKVTQLNLSGSSLDKAKLLDLPPEIGTITTLTRLDLGYNDFTYLPKEIGNLINLKTLILSQNKLESLPPEIGELKNLEELYLYRNQLKTLPKEIGKLVQLRYLQLIQNRIEFLPDEIGNLKNLSSLEIYENKLTFLPKTFGNLINLKWLDLRANNLTELPDEVKNLQNLESIALSNNKMNFIPKVIFDLKNLKSLGFSSNNLTFLPKEIENLKHLETLELRANKLKTLPKEIGKLPMLRYLDLTANELIELPEEILECRRLGYLELGRNKLDIPENLINSRTSPHRILEYYFKNKKN